LFARTKEVLMVNKIASTERKLKDRVYSKRVYSYTSAFKETFKVGDLVELRPRALVLYKKLEGEVFAGRLVTQTRIKSLFPDIRGLVRLEKRLGGYWTWSVNDLELVSRKAGS
jgi:hypothetical protein